MSDFASKFRAMRERRGLTQDELADAAGCSLATITVVEQGKPRSWTPKIARAIASAMQQQTPFDAAELAAFSAHAKMAPTVLNPPLQAAQHPLHALADRAADSIGTEAVTVILQTLSRLQPTERARPVRQPRQPLAVHLEHQYPKENMVVHEIRPVMPPPASPRPVPAKRAHG